MGGGDRGLGGIGDQGTVTVRDTILSGNTADGDPSNCSARRAARSRRSGTTSRAGPTAASPPRATRRTPTRSSARSRTTAARRTRRRCRVFEPGGRRRQSDCPPPPPTSAGSRVRRATRLRHRARSSSLAAPATTTSRTRPLGGRRVGLDDRARTSARPSRTASRASHAAPAGADHDGQDGVVDVAGAEHRRVRLRHARQRPRHDARRLHGPGLSAASRRSASNDDVGTDDVTEQRRVPRERRPDVLHSGRELRTASHGGNIDLDVGRGPRQRRLRERRPDLPGCPARSTARRSARRSRATSRTATGSRTTASGTPGRRRRTVPPRSSPRARSARRSTSSRGAPSTPSPRSRATSTATTSPFRSRPRPARRTTSGSRRTTTSRGRSR